MGTIVFGHVRPKYDEVTDMNEATIGLTVMTALIGAVFLGFLIWGIRSGQFHDVEDAKYQVFRKQKKPEKNQGEPTEKPEKEVKSDNGN
jgi:cbb3-type cytochrome oxidase maturation protein